MKRPPGLWILLSAGVLWLSLQDVYGIRATALIFAKSTTTTTTTASPEELSDETATNTESSSNSDVANANDTKPALTGVPQVDYVWDPNLPQELNGFNLSAYPFYERVPEEIDFKCDGLHDGFYASVPHKCQVYHHCLFGTRYDFLCANYTAFDQKTFICHFVSEVDCENSKKFWHRNDALYVAASTTTVRPAYNLNIYTTAPPAGEPITPLAQDPLPPGPAVARRPAGGRRPYRPRRRRPQFEYYDDEEYDDDYYEERPRSNRGRKRPRPRPRPVYDDEEYDEYEDDRYEKRGGGRRDNDRRRPYDSRRTESRRRNKDRRKPEYDDDEDVDERFEDSDYMKGRRKGDRRPSDKRRPVIEDYEPEVVERKPSRKNKRPIESEEYDDEIPEPDTRREKPSRKGDRYKPAKEEKTTTSKDERPIIKPVSGSIYDRPRMAPRINLPVPKNAADKFSYHTAAVKTTPPTKAADEEYYDEYEEESPPPPKRSKHSNRKAPISEEDKDLSDSESKESRSPKDRPKKPESDEVSERPSRPKYGNGRSKFTLARTPSTKKPAPITEEYYDEYEEEEIVKPAKIPRKPSKKESTPTSTTSTTTTSTTTSTTTTSTTTPLPDAGRDKHEPVVRIVKRPFLPSRGGNPYSARGLQPVGFKASDSTEQDTSAANSEQNVSEEKRLTKPSSPGEIENKSTDKVEHIPLDPQEKIEVFKASPVIIKIPMRSKYASTETQEDFAIESSRPQAEIRQTQNNFKNKEFSGPRTTQKPKILVEKNPLDLNEYDVTLNDALNPTLPNLPVRGYPTGFSNAANDYSYSSYNRPRYDSINSASDSDYVYQNPTPSRQQSQAQRYQTINYRREAHLPSRTQAIYTSFT